MMRSMTKPADSNIKIVSTLAEDTVIPILAAKFVTDNNGKSIMIARGSSVKPSFEVVTFVNEETGAILSDITLSRQPVTNFLIDTASIAANNLRTTRKAYDESTVTVVGNTDFAIAAPTMAPEQEDEAGDNVELSIEQKLQSLDVVDAATVTKSKKNSSKKKEIEVPAAGSLTTVLVQALHSGDSGLLEACLQHSKPDVINNTVRKLPTEYLIPLMLELIQRFQEKPGRAPILLLWIKSILLIHTAYLMTVPNLVGKLSGFYQALDTRVGVFPKLLALRGRLDIVQSQVNVKSYSNINEKQLQRAQMAENVYVELDSDDEAEAEEELLSMDEDEEDENDEDEELDEDEEEEDEDEVF